MSAKDNYSPDTASFRWVAEKGRDSLLDLCPSADWPECPIPTLIYLDHVELAAALVDHNLKALTFTCCGRRVFQIELPHGHLGDLVECGLPLGWREECDPCCPHWEGDAHREERELQLKIRSIPEVADHVETLERQAEHLANNALLYHAYYTAQIAVEKDLKTHCESLLKRIGELEHQLSDDKYILWEEHLTKEKERELEDAAFWAATADVDQGEA